jgi:hypothetical protein
LLFGYLHTVQPPLLATTRILYSRSIGTVEYAMQVPHLVPHLGAISTLNGWSIGTLQYSIQKPLGFACGDFYGVFGSVYDVSLLIRYYNTPGDKSKIKDS